MRLECREGLTCCFPWFLWIWISYWTGLWVGGGGLDVLSMAMCATTVAARIMWVLPGLIDYSKSSAPSQVAKLGLISSRCRAMELMWADVSLAHLLFTIHTSIL